MSKLTTQYGSAGDKNQGINWETKVNDNLDIPSDLRESQAGAMLSKSENPTLYFYQV